MTTTIDKIEIFEEILQRKVEELVRILRSRDGITIEKSPDQMDDTQYESARDLAIRNADRESTLLRDVKTALQQIRDGSFGTCIMCDQCISAKRLSAAPSALRCIEECQEIADRIGSQSWNPLSDSLLNAA